MQPPHRAPSGRQPPPEAGAVRQIRGHGQAAPRPRRRRPGHRWRTSPAEGGLLTAAVVAVLATTQHAKARAVKAAPLWGVHFSLDGSRLVCYPPHQTRAAGRTRAPKGQGGRARRGGTSHRRLRGEPAPKRGGHSPRRAGAAKAAAPERLIQNNGLGGTSLPHNERGHTQPAPQRLGNPRCQRPPRPPGRPSEHPTPHHHRTSGRGRGYPAGLGAAAPGQTRSESRPRTATEEPGVARAATAAPTQTDGRGLSQSVPRRGTPLSSPRRNRLPLGSLWRHLPTTAAAASGRMSRPRPSGESGRTEEPLSSLFRGREGRAISPAPRVSRAPGARFPGHPLT